MEWRPNRAFDEVHGYTMQFRLGPRKTDFITDWIKLEQCNHAPKPTQYQGEREFWKNLKAMVMVSSSGLSHAGLLHSGRHRLDVDSTCVAKFTQHPRSPTIEHTRSTNGAELNGFSSQYKYVQKARPFLTFLSLFIG